MNKKNEQKHVILDLIINVYLWEQQQKENFMENTLS